MKVLGIAEQSCYRSPVYIALVSHREVQAAFEKRYSDPLPELKVGEEINLADIPNQRERIVEATKKMSDAYQEFVKAAPVMAELARVLANTSQTTVNSEEQPA